MAPSTAPSGVERPKSFAPRQPSDGGVGASGRLGSVIETRECCFGKVRARSVSGQLAREVVHLKRCPRRLDGSARIRSMLDQTSQCVRRTTAGSAA